MDDVFGGPPKTARQRRAFPGWPGFALFGFRISDFGFRIFPALLLATTLFLPATSLATVTVNALFGSNTVLQRERPVPVWGTASSNKTVTVTFNGQSKSVTADARGNWELTLDPMPANPVGGVLTISEAGGNTLTRTSVVVGDVWLCSGQSNMAMTLSGCDRPTDISSANLPGLRTFVVPLANLGAPSTNLTGSWMICSPATAGNFSAAAFYFARKLYQDQNTNIPLGLVVSSVGGTRIDPWLAPEGLTDIPVLAPLYSQPILSYGPFSLFNGMIYPLAPYAMKGVVWYQGENGETTVQSADSYCLKMKALIQGWKRVFRLEDMAFYFVQIANWGTTPSSATPVLFSGAWDADTRLQQAAAMSLPHSGMASALDIGDSADMHPKDKLDLGERLAFWALKNDYGRTNLATSGPILRDVTVSGNKAICTFDYAGSGLMVGAKTPYQPTRETNSPLALFSIAGTNGVWYWATATIVGDTLELTSPSVAAPKKIAYACWQNPLGVNLYNRDGLPASPFYVDDVAAKLTIAATAVTGGAISPAGTTTFLKRQTALYTITPDTGNYMLDLLVDGVSVGAVRQYTFDPLYTNHTIHATFTNALPAHRINATAGAGGSISPTGEVSVAQGGAQAFTIAPNPGCLLSLAVDGQPMGARGSFTFSDLSTSHSIAATFSCTIKASAGAGGKIVPSGTLTVPAGTNQTFTITPNSFYKISNVQVDGVSQGPLASYSFTNVSAPHTIGVGFALLPPTLALSANASGTLDITWPDTYTGSLLWSPVVGPAASWNPVSETPAHIGSFYKVTVTPGPGAIFYCLKQ